jgi:hypothetical protein
MDYDVLPGPPLAEQARTVMARAGAAVVSCPDSRGLFPVTVPVRVTRTGDPILLPRHGSALARHLAASPALVTVTVPADAPFSALRLSGMTGSGPGSGPDAPAYPVTLRSLEFTGSVPAQVALAQYEAAAPDPLRHEAPAILDHLEHHHMAELTGCVRAHGITAAECAVPRRLDRFGLELLVLLPTGLAAVRLAFPDGPVTTIAAVPVSIRAMLTCRCGDLAQH